MVLFHVKFACNLAISNLVFRWELCKGSVWENVKKCSRLCNEVGARGWISRVIRGLHVARRCTQVKHAEKLKHRASCSTTGQKIQIDHSVSSWFGLATQSSREAKSPVHSIMKIIDSSYSFLTPVQIPLIPTKYRELPERILREKL